MSQTEAACLVTLTLAEGYANAPQESNGDLEKRRSFLHSDNRALKFRSALEAYPYRVARAGTNVWKLERAIQDAAELPTYVWQGKTNSLSGFHERTKTCAFLVIKDDRILIETYLAGSSESSRFYSFSLGKAITSTLVGCALEEGKIDSLEDPLIKYLPGLTGSAFETASVKDTLMMMTGVHDSELASSSGDPPYFLRLLRESLEEQKYRLVEGANRLRLEYPPGTKFNYSTLNAELLGWLVETVTRSRLTAYLERRLWQPAGMEAEAAWVLDGPPAIGRELAGGGLVATLRDYGRFGLMMLHEGRANGRQVVSPEWVHEATMPNRPGVQYGQLFKGNPLGYGYYWWLFPNGRFTAQGVFGQFIYVAPDANMVIVKLSYWPDPGWLPELEQECYAMFDSLIRSLR